MNDCYLEHYILSYFSLDRITRLSQIFHVFQGKRTPSMFYLIERNKWHHGFSLGDQIKDKEFEAFIQKLLEKQWIEEKDKGYILTNLGQEVSKNYFETHFYPSSLKRMTYTTVRKPFWNRLQLFTQVFSELSYQNRKYIPVIKHPHHQENVRQLFNQFGQEKEKILARWIEEQSFLFKKLKPEKANVLARLLTGHQQIGDTKDQIAQELEMEPMAFYFYLQVAIEDLIQVIIKNQSKVKISFAILNQMQLETNQGLSASTNQTVQLLKAGHTIEQISKIRSIKENTVREHILEMAFIHEAFPIQKMIPSSIYTYLNQRFDEEENYHFRQALEEKETIEFMHFRLVELERMRKVEE